MYGIPDFKLEKWVVERRLKVMEEEGVVFKTNANVGENIAVKDLMDEFDAVVLCTGSTVPRDLPIPGRHFKGVHFAMDFLTQQNNRVTAGRRGLWKEDILATGKNVVVIGGGDTGSDCVGTSNRHKAKSVTQIELLSQPPAERTADNPWPNWPMILRTSSSHEEGASRNWCMHTKAFIGDEQGNLKAIKLVEIKWELNKETGRSSFVEVPDTEKDVPCELALLAIGFLHTQKKGMIEELGLALDERGNVKCTNYQSSVDKVFAAGDSRRGQSLVVWAISEGREAARAVDTYLMGASMLESKDDSLINVARIA